MQAVVGHRDDARVGLDGAEGIVGSLFVRLCGGGREGGREEEIETMEQKKRNCSDVVC